MVVVNVGQGIQLSVWIVSGSVKLEEYQADLQGQTHTCFIPSAEGQIFEINHQILSYGPRHSTVVIRAHLDGVYATGHAVAPTTLMHAPSVLSGVPVSANEERPFMFSRLTLTDDEQMAPITLDGMKDLGTIQIEVELAIETRRTIPSNPLISLPGQNLIHEKSKKIGSHAVTLGQSVVKQQSAYSVSVQSIGIPKTHIKFQYAPADYLRAQGIMPALPPRVPSVRPPSPPPAASILRNSSRVKTENATSQVEVKKETTASTNGAGSSKRSLVINISSDDDDDNDGGSTTADRAAYARVKKHLNTRKSSAANKKAKTEPFDGFVSGEVIVLSD